MLYRKEAAATEYELVSLMTIRAAKRPSKAGRKAVRTGKQVTVSAEMPVVEVTDGMAVDPNHVYGILRLAGRQEIAVLPPERVAIELARLGRHPYVATTQPAGAEELAEESSNGFRKVCLLLRSATGVDFLQYKPATLRRLAGSAGRDITELKRSETTLLRYQQELRALTARLIAAREDSSKHLAGKGTRIEVRVPLRPREA
jgi:hypothetical protein